MFVSCVAPFVLLYAVTTPRDLAYARGSFEARLASGRKLYVMGMNANGYNEAFFPVGVSSRRYVIDYGSGHDLEFQQVVRGVPRTVWRLDLRDQKSGGGKGRADGSGTLLRMLADGGLEIASRRLTRVQRVALGAHVSFVGYSLGAVTDDLGMEFVSKNGKGRFSVYDPNPIRFKPPFFPIPAEECRLLGFGSTEWHGSGKFEITVH